MKLTRRKALEITIRMWVWIRKQLQTGNGDEYIWTLKEQWMSRHGYTNMESNCPCCQYASVDCTCCPIWGKLPYSCMDLSSEYIKAGHGVTRKARVDGCNELIALARKRLRELNKEKR